MVIVIIASMININNIYKDKTLTLSNSTDQKCIKI